jgi:hypothetical protein
LFFKAFIKTLSLSDKPQYLGLLAQAGSPEENTRKPKPNPPQSHADARFANQSHQFVERFPAFHPQSTNQACKSKQAHDNEAVARYVEHVKTTMNTLPNLLANRVPLQNILWKSRSLHSQIQSYISNTYKFTHT